MLFVQAIWIFTPLKSLSPVQEMITLFPDDMAVGVTVAEVMVSDAGAIVTICSLEILSAVDPVESLAISFTPTCFEVPLMLVIIKSPASDGLSLTVESVLHGYDVPFVYFILIPSGQLNLRIGASPPDVLHVADMGCPLYI